MRRMGTFFVVASILLLALPALAQDQPEIVGRVFFIQPKAGTQQQYEAGYKKHIAWHQQQKDTWAWYTWEFETGDRIGQYVTGTFDHNWADFDAHAQVDAADNTDYLANVGQHVDSLSGIIVAIMPKLSRPPAGEGGPTPLSEVLTFHLNVGQVEEFLNAAAKVQKASEKTNWPVHYLWYGLVNGGEHPTFYLVLPRDNWAGFKDPDKPFPAMLAEAYGQAEAQEIQRAFDKAVHCIRSETIRYRPDLSYAPPPAK